jgi:hypothetical protein
MTCVAVSVIEATTAAIPPTRNTIGRDVRLTTFEVIGIASDCGGKNESL